MKEPGEVAWEMFGEEVAKTAQEYGPVVAVTVMSMHRNVLRMTIELEEIVKVPKSRLLMAYIELLARYDARLEEKQATDTLPGDILK